MRLAAGIDIGGTKIALGLVDAAGVAVAEERLDTVAARPWAEAARRLIAALRRLLAEAGVAADELTGIGIGCAGPVDPPSGEVRNPWTLPGWSGASLFPSCRRPSPCRSRGEAADAVAECARVARVLSTWGDIDLCLLGLGLNGHLGFNEPSYVTSDGAHVSRLTAESTRHAMLGGCSVPGHGLTLGIGDLMRARRALLIATGAGKRAVVGLVLHARESPRVPATALRAHRDALALLDLAAVG